MSELRRAAQAVLDRWDSPSWEWVKQGPTAALMADLRAALAEPVQEPVAWMDIDSDGNRLSVRQWSDGNRDEVPLYTAPPQRKPLTEEEIRNAISTFKAAEELMGVNHVHVARAIERAHGIGEQQ